MLCNLAVFWSRRGFLFIPPTHSNLMFSSAGLARGEEQLDVVSGSAVTLKCRFDPQLTQKRSTLYWIRSNRINHDNVAIGETAFHQDYRSVYLAASSNLSGVCLPRSSARVGRKFRLHSIIRILYNFFVLADLWGLAIKSHAIEKCHFIITFIYQMRNDHKSLAPYIHFMY